MKAEPLQQVSVPISQQKAWFRSGTDEQSIQACYDLLSSGHSLSEILIALKELGPLNKAQSDLVDAPAIAEISHLVGEFTAPPQREILQVAERVEVSRILVPLNAEPQQRAYNEKKSRPLAVVLFWLIPAMSLMLVGIGGKLLIDAGLLRNSESATRGAETIDPTPAITEVGISAPGLFTAASAGKLAVTASPPESTTQAVGTVLDNKQDRGPLIDKRTQERPAARTLPPPTSRESSVQRLHTRIYPSPPMEWRLPNRLTDGF
jgi:hypothetical protein